MSTLQIVFSIIGLLVIAAVVAHGMWTIRNNEKNQQQRAQDIERKRHASDFDDDGIGEVRVIRKAAEKPAAKSQPKPEAKAEPPEQAPAQPAEYSQPAQAKAAPIRANGDDGTDEEDALPSIKTDVRVERKPEAKPAPKQTEQPTQQPTQQSMELPVDDGDEPPLNQEPDMVIALHVVGSIEGSVLLQQMTELGFKYGEFDIFHRHVDTAGTGPVLFSLANMFNPGTFDIDNIETFQTEGVALFLALPIKSDSMKAFTMMHNAAVKLAKAVDNGQVLDEHRNPLTRQAVQHIHQSIREYERKRLIRQ